MPDSNHSSNNNRRGRSGYGHKYGKNRRDHQKNGENTQERAARQLSTTYVCPRCQQPIQDISSALADRHTGVPIHFDCALQFLQQSENIRENEKIIYIGQGNFAVVCFENPHDLRHFTIIRKLEWEERDKKQDWRAEIAGIFSQVK